MTRRSSSFELTGGLDEISQPLAIKPGRAIACLNHEALDFGYGRIEGTERFDGRTGPTAYPFWIMAFDTGSTAIMAGATVTGASSGATGVVLIDANLVSGAWDGGGEGAVGIRSLTGSFAINENILVSGSPVAKVAQEPIAGAANSGDAYEAQVAEAARDYARGLVQTVPGSGPVRGVWEFEGTVYAFRDNAGATAAKLFKSTTSGWVEVTLGKTIAFTSGGATEIVEGNTITGATSAATATVERVIVQSGDWTAGDAAGYFVLSNVTGTFVAENLNVGASTNLATIAAAPAQIALPAGGRYFFITHNFYGSSATRRVYGINGVGPGFEFDGTVFCPILTGMVTDTPTRVAMFRNHLFFAFPNGSVQHCAPGDPLSWEAITGAAEIGVGSDIADFIASIDSLLILAEHGIFALTGNDASDWVLSPITLESGALPFTGQRVGPGVYVDNNGLRSITTTQAFGNFTLNTITQAVQRTMQRKRLAGVLPCASVIVRTKGHYRLFFDDGSGFSFYLGRKYPEPMYFDLGKVVTCISSNESLDNVERVFFGSTDGYVYQMDVGTSLDGEAIPAFIQLAYANMGSPNVLKRFHKVSLEAIASSASALNIAIEYDYATREQTANSQQVVETQGVGGLWNVANWGEFFWSGPDENVLEAYVDGQGRNASIIVFSDSADTPQYVLRGATFFYADRGAIR